MSVDAMSLSDLDEHWMTAALARARRGDPSPNPHVGAVLVSPSGDLLAEAHHERAGGPHAEVSVIRAAGESARGATLYVTLEPCNHTGRTEPCTDAIIEAGISRVVMGCRDPNPNVAGGGLERLRRAGVDVVVSSLLAEAARVIAPWQKHVETGLPYVTLKLAISLDGRIATRSGKSKWVTGSEARARVHVLRAEHDAVAVGVGTAIADDPLLTVRSAPGRSPKRVVFDTHLRLSPSSQLVATTSPELPLIVLTGPEPPQAAEELLTSLHVQVVRCPLSSEGRVDVTEALRELGARDVVSLLVEGGAELAGSMLAQRHADELHAFVAPILLGPRGRPGVVDWAGPDDPARAPRIGEPSWECCGADAHVFGPLVYPEKTHAR